MPPSPEPREDETTGFHTITPQEAEELREQLPANSRLRELTQMFELLKNTTRSRILLFLSLRELCVHDLTALLGMKQPAVSHQLRKLQDRGLLDRRKEGRVVYYSLRSEAGIRLIEQGVDLLGEEDTR